MASFLKNKYKLIDTNLFDFVEASGSAAWIREFEDWGTDVEVHDDDDDDEDEHEHHHDHDHEEHEHHHHHHHHHEGVENEEEGTALEYDINTFVYYRRRPFDEAKFKEWVSKDFDKHHIIRCKGIIYLTGYEQYVYLFESAGKQKNLGLQGMWYSEQLSKKELANMLKYDEGFKHDWDETYHDKLIKLVFIGQNLDEKKIRKELDQI